MQNVTNFDGTCHHYDEFFNGSGVGRIEEFIDSYLRGTRSPIRFEHFRRIREGGVSAVTSDLRKALYDCLPGLAQFIFSYAHINHHPLPPAIVEGNHVSIQHRIDLPPDVFRITRMIEKNLRVFKYATKDRPKSLEDVVEIVRSREKITAKAREVSAILGKLSVSVNLKLANELARHGGKTPGNMGAEKLLAVWELYESVLSELHNALTDFDTASAILTALELAFGSGGLTPEAEAILHSKESPLHRLRDLYKCLGAFIYINPIPVVPTESYRKGRSILTGFKDFDQSEFGRQSAGVFFTVPFGLNMPTDEARDLVDQANSLLDSRDQFRILGRTGLIAVSQQDHAAESLLNGASESIRREGIAAVSPKVVHRKEQAERVRADLRRYAYRVNAKNLDTGKGAAFSIDNIWSKRWKMSDPIRDDGAYPDVGLAVAQFFTQD